MVSNHTNIDYYLKLFKGLRDKINDFIYDNTELIDSVDIGKDDLKKFSLMIMFSDDGGNSFRWLLLDDQKEFVIKRLETNNSIKNLAIKSNEFFKNWIKFRLQKSGLVNYFLQTPKNTEFIKNFTKEKYLISQGYEKDYENQKYFLNLRKVYRGALNNDQFDPFKELEKNWGFKDVPFYYVKLPKTKELQFIAIFPVISSEQNVFFERADLIFTLVKNAVLGANLMKEIIDENLLVLYQQQLKTAIISILIDSYAHNISAHSLAALKWWIELRHKMLDKRFYVSADKGLKIEKLLPESIEIDQNFIKETSEKYYETLGLTDSKYNKEFFSLFDYLQFGANKLNKKTISSNDFDANKVIDNIFSFTHSDDELCKDKSKGIVSNISKKEKEETKPVKAFFPRFPVPIDYALYPFFKFLRDKGAFWSGVTRDTAYGGETKTWYQILWEDFANNPLYLGTIAKSERISKININLAVKTDDGWIKGRFVTIDMSIINEEEKLSLLNDDPMKEKDKIKKDDCDFNSNCSLEYSKYSKYAFVKLGGCFQAFRIELSKDKYNVFLPGGLIGEHALFTIFENTLRNIKHYKDQGVLDGIRKDGIDFWISIQEEKLSLQKKDGKKPELFKVSVWLEHKTDLVKFEKDNNNLKECLWKKVTDSTLKRVLDDNGAPRMGGNSQDKACAAMLFNNKFISVESIEGERNYLYYPWIHFTTNTNENHYDSDYDLPKTRNENFSYYYANEENAKKFVEKYVNGLNNVVKGYLKKYFYLWRSEDYLLINDQSDLLGENTSRFKFVVLSDDIKEDREKLINEIRENGIIRLLYKKNNNDSFSSKDLIDKLEKEIPHKFKEEALKINNEKLKLLYHIWLKNWLKYNNDFKISFNKDKKNWAVIIIDDKNFMNSYHINDNEKKIKEPNDSIDIKIILSHGGDEENESCNVRSHGYFWGKYFVNAPSKAPEDLGNPEVYDRQKEYLLLELMEVLATRIEIFDNRINLRMSQLDKTKRKKVFEKILRLNVYEELINNVQDKTATFNEHLDVLKSSKKNEPLILIIHLSYIEAMDYKEENINIFIEQHLKDFFNNDNFIFVLTSGRGRDAWKKNLNDKYRKQTIFKPVESLIGAVEAGLSYNDNFDVKHNLIKVIFGS